MKELCKHTICYPIIEKYGGFCVGYKCRINFDECPDDNDKNCKEFIGYKPEEIIFNFENGSTIKTIPTKDVSSRSRIRHYDLNTEGELYD